MNQSPRRAERSFRVPVAPLLISLLCGCGGGVQPSQAPASTPPTTPSYGDGAPPSPTDAAHVAPAQPAPSPAVLPPPPPPPPSGDQPAERGADRIAARADLDRALRDLESAAGDCESACRALASMERATSHLCSLAAEPDDQRRCDDARLRLTAARGRVRAACGGCR
jgi:hypothetical protein